MNQGSQRNADLTIYRDSYLRVTMWPFSTHYPEIAFHELREKYDYIIVGKLFLLGTLG